MQYTHYDMGQLSGNDVVEVTLSGNAANVRLMDGSNFQSYRNGRQHRGYGGLARKSPVHLQVPHSGTWHVVVDMQGLQGTVRSSARLLPRPLPELREIPLSSVPSLVRGRQAAPGGDLNDDVREYDVFICHASEDKEEVAGPLAHALNVTSHKAGAWAVDGWG